MDPRKFQQPSAPPPPPYSSVVNDPSKYQIYPQLNQQQQRAPEFDQFVNRYESKFILVTTR